MPISRLLAILVLAAAARAGAEPLVILPPVGDNAAGSELGALMHAHAERLLIEGGAPAVSALRHVLAVAEALHAPPPKWFGGPWPERLGRQLGARRVVTARLHAAAAGYTLDVQVVDGGKPGAVTTKALPSPLSAAVSAGARALAEAALGAPLKSEDAWPASVTDRAVTSYAACLASVARQPIVLDSPQLLRTDELERAINSCRDALQAAPALDEARAAMGLALAILGRSQESADALMKVPTARYDASLWLAHYWLVTRYRSPDGGLEILREVVRRFPGALAGRVMLAEHLYQTRQNDQALAAWSQVLALAPDSPLTRSRVSATLARLGKNDQAIATAKQIVALLPNEPTSTLVLAARYLDAGRAADAIATLEPLAVDGAAPKIYETLGRAYLRAGQPARARHEFERTRDESLRKSVEWRVRGQALAGLLRVAAIVNDDQLAAEVVDQARDEDYVPFLRALGDPAVTVPLDRAERVVAKARQPPRPTGPRYQRPAEATPFTLDAAGEIDPHAHRLSAPPNFIQLLKF